MISTNDFKRGTRIELDGEPYAISDMSTQTTGGRGGQTLIRCKLRNIKTGALIDRTFSGGDRVKSPDFEIRPSEYLYDEGGETYYFMDKSTYEQFPLKRKDVEEELPFIRANDEVRALVFNGNCIGIEAVGGRVLDERMLDNHVVDRRLWRALPGGHPGRLLQHAAHQLRHAKSNLRTASCRLQPAWFL